jgi:hypothetical protein
MGKRRDKKPSNLEAMLEDDKDGIQSLETM